MNKFLIVFETRRDENDEWDLSKEVVESPLESLTKEDAKILLKTWLQVDIISIKKQN